MDFLTKMGLIPNYTKNNIALFNVDCLKLMEEMEEGCIDCIVSDPPYKLTKRGYGKPKEGKKYCGGMLGIYNNNNNDDMQYIKDGKLFKYNDIMFEEWMPLLYKVLKERWSLLPDDKL